MHSFQICNSFFEKTLKISAMAGEPPENRPKKDRTPQNASNFFSLKKYFSGMEAWSPDFFPFCTKNSRLFR